MRIIDNKQNRLIEVLESVVDSNTDIYYAGEYVTAYSLFSLYPTFNKSRSVNLLLDYDLDSINTNLLHNNDEEVLNLNLDRKMKVDKVVKMEWVSSLKPSNTNIPKFETENHVVEEVQFMTCTVSNLDKHGKVVVDLFQKYIPYQIVLVVEDEGYWMLNLTNKRINLNDKSKRTIEKSFTTNLFNKIESEAVKRFLKTLSFDRVNRTNLNTVYQSYINSVIQLKSSEITGVFNDQNLQNNQRDIESIERKENLEMEIITLKNQLKKETQLNSQVSINMEIQKRKQEIQNIKQTLSQ